MSSFTEKLVDFDIMVESEPRREPPARAGQLSDHTSALEESVYKLKSMLATVERTQKYFHTRENRGFSLVRSTQKYVQTFLVRGTRKFGHRVYGSIPGICVAKLLYKYWAKIQGVKTGYYIFGWLVVYLFLGINTRLIVSFPQCPVLRALAQESRACQSL
ncbi:unnamed protein product [Rhizoctonia solani]|uniref:GOLD domain-containing protein n=1 Tax=Rhizoctonia solani TaxID=456999 RepID=A0A8H3GXZ1_9AGAM|nr:unnamed protein product [Rhizoctonia solani]